MDVRAVARLVRGGSIRDRLVALRTGRAGIRLAMMGAALDTGVLDELDRAPRTVPELAERLGFRDQGLLTAYLQVLRAAGQLRISSGRWRLTRRGRATVHDDLVRATYEAFADYHSGLYRDLGTQLRGGPGRSDIAEKGELIARLSRAFDPFVAGYLSNLVVERVPRRILDAGCGSGLQLAQMLEAAPGATGLGCEVDRAAAALARRTLHDRGLAGRAEVVTRDVRDLLGEDGTGGPVDLVLLANAVYYVPPEERVALFQSLAGVLSPGGALVVVTTALTDDEFSRHFDLLLRAQDGRMELPDVDVLAQQLRQAGLRPGSATRIAPGEPLTAVVAVR